MSKIIRVSEPYLSGLEKENVMDAINASEISGTYGKYISKFEQEFAELTGNKFGISTSNGTTALHTALSAIGIGSGDEVLVQTLTNMASVFSIVYTGAKPIPVDVDQTTCNIDVNIIRAKITKKTKAIMVVHLFGHSVDMDPILKIAKEFNLFVIEDCAEAHGALYKGRKIGSIGHIACFSFYANKILTTGEGGMVVTNNEELANKSRSLRSFAYGPSNNRFMHQQIGFNYRMSNLTAAFGCGQLPLLDEVISLKRKIASRYIYNLKDVRVLQLPVEKDYAYNVYWMFHVVLIGDAQGYRNFIISELGKNGIEARESFTPFNMQKIFQDQGLVKENDCPVANYIGLNGFYLPSGPKISNRDIDYVSESLINILDDI